MESEHTHIYINENKKQIQPNVKRYKCIIFHAANEQPGTSLEIFSHLLNIAVNWIAVHSFVAILRTKITMNMKRRQICIFAFYFLVGKLHQELELKTWMTIWSLFKNNDELSCITVQECWQFFRWWGSHGNLHYFSFDFKPF